MGEWMGTVLTIGFVAIALCVVYRTFWDRPAEPDRPDVKVLASTTLDMTAKCGELCDRLMAFTSEGREGLRYKQEAEDLRRANAEHTAWRQVAAASRLAGLSESGQPEIINDAPNNIPGYDQSPDR